MSFFDPSNAPKKPDADPRVRASGWNGKKLGAFGDDSYRQKAQQAQFNSSSIVGGKIVRPIHAEPRGNLPANVHGFHNTSNASESSWTGSFTHNTDRQRNPPVGATNFARNAPTGVRGQRGASAVKIAGQTPTAKENMLPPHLRRASTASGPSMVSTPSGTSAQKNSKHGTRAALPMNSGTAAKSAKHSSRFPCSYEDCTQGFERERELKVHKHDNHDYCRVCDEDFDNDKELLCHKINSDYHICCCVCGDDFHSEGGRDRHQRQAHSTQLECKCVGCGYIFEKGSALIDHIYGNKCRDRNDRIPKLVNEETIREQRAQAALHLDIISHRVSDTGELIAAMQPSESSIISDNESDAGVSLEPKHLLDLNEPMDGASSTASSQAENGDAATDLIDLSDDGTATPKKSRHNKEFPTLGEAAMVKGKSKHQAMVDALGSLSVSGSKHGTGATMVDFREAMIAGENGEVQVVKTDWDHLNFKRHAVDGHYHCPFSKCNTTCFDVNDLKRHLTSGLHQGTDHRCLKCLRHFKSPTALIAHMESNSERCRIKETDHFGQMLSVVSGGFLGVSGRNADGTIKISALTEEELEDQAREHRALLPSEDANYNWSL